MIIWIDVENASGVRYGDGPITTASEWQNVRRLDGAGTFNFAMPASDERSNLLAHKRIVRCWGADANGIKEVGAGIIEQIDVTPGEPTVLRVSGDDLLRELANRTVGALDLFEAIDYDTTHATDPLVLRLQGYTSGTDLTLPASVDLQPWYADDDRETFLYVQHARAFSKITLTLSAVNTALSDTFQLQYYNNQDITQPLWEALPGVVNNTSAPGPDPGGNPDSVYPLGVVGEATIEFDPPVGWSPLNGLYIIRMFDQQVDLTSFTITDATVTIVEPVADGLQRIMALAPDGWALDPAGHYATASSVYMQFSGESVLTALVMLAEQTGEHFTLSPAARRVWWLGLDQADSGLRAVQATAPGDETMTITALSRTSDSYELYTRLYAHGGGVGSGRLTMEMTTRDETGYTLGPDGEYLEADTALGTYGRIDYHLSYPDIAPVDMSETQIMHAADALYDRVYNALRRRCQLQYAYRLDVVPSKYAVWPGQTVRVVYHEWVDGYHSVNIDTDLWVLEINQRVTRDGVTVAGLMVATVDYEPANDYRAVAGLMGSVQVERSIDLPASKFTTNLAGVPVAMSVNAGQITAIRRVTPIGSGWYNLDVIGRVRLAHGVVTAVEAAAGSSPPPGGGLVLPPKPNPWP